MILIGKCSYMIQHLDNKATCIQREVIYQGPRGLRVCTLGGGTKGAHTESQGWGHIYRGVECDGKRSHGTKVDTH